MNNDILLDCDDVICRLAVPLQIALGLATNNAIHWKKWKGSNLEKEYGVTTDQFIEIMINGRVIEQALPIPGVKESLNKLRDKGHAISICTKRSWHPQAVDLTKAWFEDYNLPYDNINIVGLDDKKSVTMKQLGSKRLIDDSITNCKDAIENGFEASLIRMPWHSKNTGFDTINHIADYIDTL